MYNKLVNQGFKRKLSQVKQVYSPNKQKYITELNGHKPILICTGPTGTGKTYLACQEGVNQLGPFKKILITRPAVSIHNETHGFLPGSLEKKMSPWFAPIYDNIENTVGKEHLEYLLKNKLIDMCPFGYLRGRTFNDTFIIADEMQNSTRMQFKTLLTRIGENSKLVINGDLEQTDNIHDNGLADFLTRLEYYSKYKPVNYISLINLEAEDIVRHPSVIEVLDIYQ
uniref:PhoH-like protein n=1 Tax=viral metagenome TaxID=1070528 RepID=A0A6C0I8W7_9ZZZZ